MSKTRIAPTRSAIRTAVKPAARSATSPGALRGTVTKGGPPVRRSQGDRRAEAEARLIAAARGLLSRKGWTGMTLAEVGEAAGYSRGLAAHHFGNKAGLLRALTLHINSTFMETMQAAPPPLQPGLDAVLSYVQAYLGRTDPLWTNTRTLLLLLAEALLEQSETAALLADYNRAMFSYLEQNIAIGIERGEIRADVVPSIGAEFTVGVLRGILLQRLVQGGVGDAKALRGQVVPMIRNAFAVAVAAPVSRQQPTERRK